MAIDITKPGLREEIVRAIVLARADGPRTELQVAEQCAEAVLQVPFFTELELELRRVVREPDTNDARERADRILTRLLRAK
jgi:hypothetical protein